MPASALRIREIQRGWRGIRDHTSWPARKESRLYFRRTLVKDSISAEDRVARIVGETRRSTVAGETVAAFVPFPLPTAFTAG
jgi:hypothetical protein